MNIDTVATNSVVNSSQNNYASNPRTNQGSIYNTNTGTPAKTAQIRSIARSKQAPVAMTKQQKMI